MNYRIRVSNKAQKTLKKLGRSGKFNPTVLNKILRLLEKGRVLPEQYKNHQLQGDLTGFSECHIGFNLLLQYERDEVLRLITIAKIGTHQELFGE